MAYSRKLLRQIQSGMLGGSYTNDSGSTINRLIPVTIDINDKKIGPVDINNEAHVKGIFGVTIEDIASAKEGDVILAGKVEGMEQVAGISISDVGKTVYIAASGGITLDTPQIGVNSFVAGHFVVSIGILIKSVNNPSAGVDMILNIDILGQL